VRAGRFRQPRQGLAPGRRSSTTPASSFNSESRSASQRNGAGSAPRAGPVRSSGSNYACANPMSPKPLVCEFESLVQFGNVPLVVPPLVRFLGPA
jgi:hypothetical protein